MDCILYLFAYEDIFRGLRMGGEKRYNGSDLVF